MSVDDPNAPVVPIQLSGLSGDVRNEGRFSHFRSSKPRALGFGAVPRRSALVPEGRGILDRERRFSAPGRLVEPQQSEQQRESDDALNAVTSPAERARQRSLLHKDVRLEVRARTRLHRTQSQAHTQAVSASQVVVAP